MRWLLLAILIVPALEIGVFIKVGGVIGPWWVVALILLSGILGVSFAKKEGTDIWIKARETMSYGQAPTEQIIEGICILVGAIFLFIPGFITDIIGLFLLIPWTRRPFKSLFKKWMMSKISKGTIIYRK